ncbi:MAG: hypothetical protein HOV68_07830 [Streptomycetaceae bacterium]|nr:hypothetical protein [Streptomycetaceae bacterium]
MWQRVFVVFIVVLACALPAAAFLAGHQRFTAAEADRRARIAATHPVQATLAQDVYGAANAYGRGTGGLVTAQVSWTAADGTVRAEKVPVRPPGRVGETTTIWLDRDGTPVAEPPPRDQSVLDAISVGAAVLMAGTLVLVAGYAGERALFMRARMAAWDREWAQVAPTWSARS